ncbi:MAG: tyrosine-type recombinase/integrase [Winogradskyella sp.]|nr:tyrosine-type recombinase/integrase [Winogradskyella sp.]
MTSKPTITLVKLFHKGHKQLGLKFRYNEDLLSLIRDIPLAKWSKTHRLWYLPLSDTNIKLVQNRFKKDAQLDTSGLSEAIIILDKKKPKRVWNLSTSQKDLLNKFYKYLKGKRYSKSTIDTYTFFVADFIEFNSKKPLETLTNRDVELFIETVFIKRNYSISTQRQFISALKLFIVFEPSTQINSLELVRPQKDKKLPTVLSQEEIIRLIATTANIKHRAIIALLYSGGLRIGELLQLRIEDFNFKRKQIFIRNSKGRKDRYVTLADSFIPILKNYFVTYKPQRYFVEGAGGKPYSASSVRKFLYKYVTQCGIKTKVTPHVLRHSYATHLMENGVGIRHIQELLGHSKPETTMIYTHVARKDLLQIKSPLDKAVEALKKMDKAEQKFLLSRQ